MGKLPNYLEQLIRYNEQDVRTVIGLHSGTSTDGPTAMVAWVRGVNESAALEMVTYANYEYPPDLRRALLEVMQRETGFVDRVCQADVVVGEFLAEIAFRIAAQAGIPMSEVDLIASSGQVTYLVVEGQRPEHRWIGDKAVTSMLDLGEGAVIAERTGVTTVSSLRRRDNAVGGHGAPLVPLGDWVLFRSRDEDRLVWNIGGIANVTVLPAGGGIADVWAFDNGPGNMILDALVTRYTNGQLEYDKDGAIAASGSVDSGLLAELMRHPFLHRTPPKAAARPDYGAHYTEALCVRAEALKLTMPDLIATCTAFTAEAMADAYRQFVAPRTAAKRIIVSGGGAKNPTLMRMLAQRFAPIAVCLSDEFGVPVDCREVMSMILIGNQTVQGQPGNAPAATGATAQVMLGHIDFGK